MGGSVEFGGVMSPERLVSQISGGFISFDINRQNRQPNLRDIFIVNNLLITFKKHLEISLKKLSIRCGNVTPNSAEVNHDDVIYGWNELDTILTNYEIKIAPEKKVHISIDSSEVREKLYWTKPENCDEFFRKISTEKIDWIHEHPFSALLHVSINKNFDDEGWCEYRFVRNVLEQVFLVLNVSVRGGCSFGSIQVGNNLSALHCDSMESGWRYSSLHNWPLIQPISIEKAWHWFEKFSPLHFILADNAITKSSAVLLHQSYKGDIESTDVLQLSQVIEHFYLSKGEPKVRGLNRKMPLVLGELPKNNKKLIHDFYDFRSDITHGDFPLFRPRYHETDAGFEAVESYYWEISKEIDKGVAMIISTLQFLIKNEAQSLSFIEKISVEINN